MHNLTRSVNTKRINCISLALGLFMALGMICFSDCSFIYSALLIICLPLLLRWVMCCEAEEPSQKKYGMCIALAGLLTLFCILGYCMDNDEFRAHLSGTAEILKTGVMLLSLFVSLFFVCAAAFILLGRKIKFFRAENEEAGNRLAACLYARPFLSSAVILFLLYIPYIVYAYPALFMGDTTVMLGQGYGALELSTHYPLLYVYLLTWTIKLGHFLFNSWNTAVFLASMLQLAAVICILAYGIKLLCECGVKWQWLFALLLYYVLCPIVSNYMFMSSKEAFYGSCIALFCQTAFCIMRKGWTKGKNVLLLFSALGVAFFRTEGYYVIIGTLIIFGLQNRIWIKRIVICLAAVLFAHFCMNNLLVPALGAIPGSMREGLSIPLQQTARYAAYAKDEITEEEERVILNAFNFYSLDEMAWEYNPEISDRIKSRFEWYVTSPKAMEYYKVWFKMGLKRPDIYISAFLDNYYQYFYPSAHFMSYDIELSELIQGRVNDLIGSDFHHPAALAGYREVYENVRKTAADYPPLYFVDNGGTVTWMLLIWTAWMLMNKNSKGLTLAVPMLIVLFFCLCSPVNAYHGRYQYPMAFYIPWGIIASKILSEQK